MSRRGVDDNIIELLACLLDNRLDLVRVKNLGRFQRYTAGRQNEDAERFYKLDGIDIGRCSLDYRDKSVACVALNADGMKNGGLSEVAVDKENGFALLGKRAGDIDRDGRFALVLIGAGDNESLVALFRLYIFYLGSYRLEAFNKGKANLRRVGNQQRALR